MNTMKIMSYNVRYIHGDSDDNRWENRREALVGLILSRDPDILCVQEAFDEQMQYLRASLLAYASYGVGRDDGDKAGEHSAVFYKKELFRMVHSDTKWFSPTPDVPSRGWDAHHKRICSWVLLDCVGGGSIAAASLHMDNGGAVARANAARILRDMFTPVAAHSQVFIAGDFNSAPGGEAYEIVNAAPFFDARTKSPEYTEYGSSHGFGRNENVFNIGPIDHLFMTKGEFYPIRAEVLAVKFNGRYPSDHFPLLVTLKKRK